MSLRRPSALIVLVVALAAGLAAFLALRGGDEAERTASACPQGFSRLSDEYVRELREGSGGGAGESEEGEKRESQDGKEREGEKRESGEGKDSEEREGEEREGEAGDQDASASKGACLSDKVRRPEPFGDLTKVNGATYQRFGLDAPDTYAEAAAQKQRISGRAARAVAGTQGSWTRWAPAR